MAGKPLLAGDLTIRSTTRRGILQAEYLGHITDPAGGQRAILTRRRHPQPRRLGLTWNQPLDGGGLLVSKEIHIEINLEAILQL